MQYNSIRIGLAIVASPLEIGADNAPILLGESLNILSKYQNLDIHAYQKPVNSTQNAIEAGKAFYDKRVHAICVISASWFEDYLVLDMLEECDVPVIVLGLSGMETGSLCGTQQLGYMLKQLSKPYKLIYDDSDFASALRQAIGFASSAMVRYNLRRARIGYLGHRVEGMTETAAHELALKKLFGTRVVGIDTQIFAEMIDNTEADPYKWSEIKAQVGKVICLDDDGLYSLKAYKMLKSIIDEKMLNAVAIGCYPHLMGKVCLSASLLSEEGIPIACEGDINGALGMMILNLLSSEPIHNTDLLNPIPEDNAIIFSHCGSGGFSLAKHKDDITLAPVRLMDRGLCCMFTAKPGDVTLLNIIPTLDGYKMAVVEGTAIETDMVFPGNPLKVQFKSNYRHILAWIANEGLGHHWMAGYGLLKQEISDLAKMIKCEFVSIL